ncbi:PLP-dependent aminotransferase family protein [Leucobacter allii]|uniref:PLP-dependent aminotransferase family protein n=1 Tax=Leucobacter allii TaxID=2932247 RepID=A0ABY4FGQ2_9MICO|nr:PLP-dependent aminotransferase family protein [Leucobacter allii]UOQ55853.1 PLP-dependent aminotransferase family protein [Leucobacter allii]
MALPPVALDRRLDAPLPVQLAAALREAIDAGTLRPGEIVPATRAFGARLGVARGVVVAAYEQLVAEGYLSAARGSGTRVNPELGAVQGAGAPDLSAPGPSASGLPASGPSASGLPVSDLPVPGPSAAGLPAPSDFAPDGVGEGLVARSNGAPAPLEGPSASPAGPSGPRPERVEERSAAGGSTRRIATGSSARRGAGDGADAAGAADGGSAEGAGPERGPLAPGMPITDAVDSPAWRAAWRSAATRAHLVAPPLGDPELREEIAEHLRRMRGTARSGRDVLVTAGTRDGLGLLLTALGGRSGAAPVVGVEDPGLPSLRAAARRLGARIVALPADAEGLDTGRLPEGILDAVIVTPSHQYPLGGSLPLARRRELLAWAARTGVVVVEDDFDSELRYTGSPMPTLTALDDPVRGSVVLLGTFSRTVSPALSAGYLLAPAGLRALIEPVRRELGGPVSAIVQTALAAYLASGELRRHTARMLRRYAVRRDAVSDRLAGAPGVRVRPMDGGLHAVLEFAGGAGARRRERAVVAASEAEGLGAEALGRYWQRRGEASGMAGLVIGLGGAGDAEFIRALGALRAILEATVPRAR